MKVLASVLVVAGEGKGARNHFITSRTLKLFLAPFLACEMGMVLSLKTKSNTITVLEQWVRPEAEA